MRRWFLSALLLATAATAALAVQEESAPRKPDPDFDALRARVGAVLKKDCPKAVVDVKDGLLTASYRTRKFQVYPLAKDGRIGTSLREEVGPEYDGLYLELGIEPRPYLAALGVPQDLRYPYWTTHFDAPSLPGERHIHLLLSYGSRTDQKLIEDLKQAVTGFAAETSRRATRP